MEGPTSANLFENGLSDTAGCGRSGYKKVTHVKSRMCDEPVPSSRPSFVLDQFQLVVALVKYKLDVSKALMSNGSQQLK